MHGDDIQTKASLEALPSEIVDLIAQRTYDLGGNWNCPEQCHSSPQPIQQLSLVNRRLYNLCLPYALRDVRVVANNNSSNQWATKRLLKFRTSPASLIYCRSLVLELGAISDLSDRKSLLQSIIDVLPRLPALERLKIDLSYIHAHELAHAWLEEHIELPIKWLICETRCNFLEPDCPNLQIYEEYCNQCISWATGKDPNVQCTTHESIINYDSDMFRRFIGHPGLERIAFRKVFKSGNMQRLAVVPNLKHLDLQDSWTATNTRLVPQPLSLMDVLQSISKLPQLESLAVACAGRYIDDMRPQPQIDSETNEVSEEKQLLCQTVKQLFDNVPSLMTLKAKAGCVIARSRVKHGTVSVLRFGDDLNPIVQARRFSDDGSMVRRSRARPVNERKRERIASLEVQDVHVCDASQ